MHFYSLCMRARILYLIFCGLLSFWPAESFASLGSERSACRSEFLQTKSWQNFEPERRAKILEQISELGWHNPKDPRVVPISSPEVYFDDIKAVAYELELTVAMGLTGEQQKKLVEEIDRKDSIVRQWLPPIFFEAYDNLDEDEQSIIKSSIKNANLQDGRFAKDATEIIEMLEPSYRQLTSSTASFYRTSRVVQDPANFDPAEFLRVYSQVREDSQPGRYHSKELKPEDVKRFLYAIVKKENGELEIRLDPAQTDRQLVRLQNHGIVASTDEVVLTGDAYFWEDGSLAIANLNSGHFMYGRAGQLSRQVRELNIPELAFGRNHSEAIETLDRQLMRSIFEERLGFKVRPSEAMPQVYYPDGLTWGENVDAIDDELRAVNPAGALKGLHE